MAIKKISTKWCADVDDYRCEFILDSIADVVNLPKCGVGSTATVANSTCKVYMVNASGEWRELA